jgi:hypothetical protein
VEYIKNSQDNNSKNHEDLEKLEPPSTELDKYIMYNVKPSIYQDERIPNALMCQPLYHVGKSVGGLVILAKTQTALKKLSISRSFGSPHNLYINYF